MEGQVIDSITHKREELVKKMKCLIKCLTVLALCYAGTSAQTASAQTVWSIGYWDAAQGVPISSLNGNWGGLTHIILMSCSENASSVVSCGLSNPSTDWPSIISAAHANGVKALLNWDCINSNCNLYAAAQSNLSLTINNMMTIVNTYGFDGVAMDWEHTLPNNIDDPVVDNFISALRSALGSNRQLAVAAFPKGAGKNWQTSVSKIDRLLLMDYDMEGANSSFCWFNSSLNNPAQFPAAPNSDNDGYSANGSVVYYEGWGWPASKLAIGIPFYGYSHSGTVPRTSCGSASPQNYTQMASNYGWPSGNTFDSQASAAWKPISGGYLDGETSQTITNKINYVKSNGLGGVMEYQIGYDYISGASPSHPLLAAIQTALGTNSNSYTAPSITTTSPLAVGTVGTSYSLTMSSSGTTPITWALTSGALPSGLSLNASNGVISGVPSTAGSSSFTLAASNAAGSSTRQFGLTVNPKSAASWVKLISKNSGMCLNVNGTSAGVQLVQSTCSGGSNQKFQFTSVQGGYKITAQSNSLQLDVSGGPTATQNGVPIIQWPYWGGSNEIWNTVPNVDGSYSLKALNSGKCADVLGSSKITGALIQQWQCTGGANQNWTLVPVQ